MRRRHSVWPTDRACGLNAESGTAKGSPHSSRDPAPTDARQPWDFNEVDLLRSHGRFWKVPKRLVHEGTLARLWRGPGTKRGGGTVSSVLPVLAVHTWPGKGSRGGATSQGGWTPWTPLSLRRIARLSGINKDSIRPALDALEAAGFAEAETRAGGRHAGGLQLYYRLADRLWPAEGELYSEFAAALLYGGIWAALPTAAARHLYLVLSCLDPIGSEDAYLDGIAERFHDESEWSLLDPWMDGAVAEEEIQERLLVNRRERAAVSLRELSGLSGLTRNTLLSAREALLDPRFAGKSLVRMQRASAVLPAWYAVNRPVPEWRSF